MIANFTDSKAEEYLKFLSELSSLGEDAISHILNGTSNIRSLKAADNYTAVESAVKEDSISMAVSAANLVKFLNNSFNEMVDFNNDMDKFISCSIAYYWFYRDISGISRTPKNLLLSGGVDKYSLLKSKNIKLPYVFSADIFEGNQNIGFDSCIPRTASPEADRIRYFVSLTEIKPDTLKSFFSSGAFIPCFHSLEAAKVAMQLRDCLKAEFVRSGALLTQIFSNTEDGLITETVRLFIEVKNSYKDASAILDFIGDLTEKFKEAGLYFEEKYECSLGLSLNKLNKLLDSLRPKEANAISVVSSNESIPAELEGSLSRILEFSNLQPEKADYFISQLKAFKKLDNKEKYELMPAEARRMTNTIFLEIYEAVLNRALAENTNDKAIDMFLTFGFLDSELLSIHQTIALYNLLNIYGDDNNVYTSKKWFAKIFENIRAPSINEMGLDYDQVLKERNYKRASAAKSSAAKSDDISDDRKQKINYEIMNMFQAGNKLCYGQISTYFPILHGDLLPEDILKAAVTINKVKDSLQNVLKEDFSAFHREVFYTGKNSAFTKELVMKQVIPDIILLPTAGVKAIMWQETGGRSKLTPGRFIIPIFTSEDLNSLMIKLTGNFRWELCRAIMGGRWNDVSYDSLTSDYSDYILEYKKNKNLSQDSKDKLKMQIQRHHGSLRNIFSYDYEAWIKSESKGIRKLNKEARAILYRYCPFNRSFREELIRQPAYTDIATQFENERRKFAREIENRYSAHERRGHQLEPELLDNLKFYLEL